MKRTLFLLACVSMLPGCIAWEIRDEMRVTNQHLCEVKPMLVQTLLNVEETNDKIDQTNARLVDVHGTLSETYAQLVVVHASLGKTHEHLTAMETALGRTNPKLLDLDAGLERLRVLDQVNASIRDVNGALRPLSSAMGSLGGAISFLGFGDSAMEAPPEQGVQTIGESPDVGEHAAATAGARRPDPLLGTWVMVYPPPEGDRSLAKIMVLSADGKFVAAVGGGSPTEGAWSRDGKFVTFEKVSDRPQRASGISANNDQTASPQETVTERVELLTLNARTLTVRSGETIRVYAKP
ncbi:MAG: hypothetical protein KF859_00670 [Phycisphaeraceae bacterium]|nr:hypothetical protein [Phycisphaeraceae bacterium]